jgi:hypothetical protein
MSAITITETHPVPPIRVDTDDLELRGFYSQRFLDSDGVTPVYPGNGKDGFYYSIPCTRNADNELIIPAFDIRTTDGVDNTSSRFTGQLYVDGVADVVIFGYPNGPGWQIPEIDAPTTTWDELDLYNQGQVQFPFGVPTTLAAQIIIALIKRQLGEFAYMAVGINGIGQASFAPVDAAEPIVLMENDPKVGSWFNITSYGAATTNTAAENATAVAAAVTAAAGVGGGIYWPVGFFPINSITISVPVLFAPGESGPRPASGQTVTFTGPIWADQSKHFDTLTSGGLVSFSGSVAPPVLSPLWWKKNAIPGTTDMTAAIQVAMDNAVITGAAVYIPTGSYNITSSLTSTGDTLLWIIGNGWGTKLINQAPSSNPTFAFTAKQRFHLDNFSILGRSGFPNDGISMTALSGNGTYSNLLLCPNGTGIHLADTNTVQIPNCSYWPSGFNNGATGTAANLLHAILADGTYVHDVHIDGLNTSGYTTIANGGSAIKWDVPRFGGANNTVTNSEIEGAGPTVSRSFDLTGVIAFQAIGNYIDQSDVKVLKSNESEFFNYTASGNTMTIGDGTAPNGCVNVLVRHGAGSLTIDAQSQGCGALDSIFGISPFYSNSGTLRVTRNVRGSGSVLLPDEAGAAGMRWYGHSVNEGSSTDIVYSAGDYTASSGSWTVDNADVVAGANYYVIIGKQMTWNFFLQNTTITGTPANLFIAIPGGFLADSRSDGILALSNNGGAFVPAEMQITGSGVSVIQLYPGLNGGAFAAGSNNNALKGNITFQIQ